jgi:hypothetical protein
VDILLQACYNSLHPCCLGNIWGHFTATLLSRDHLWTFYYNPSTIHYIAAALGTFGDISLQLCSLGIIWGHFTISLLQFNTPLLSWGHLGIYDCIPALLGPFGDISLYPCYNLSHPCYLGAIWGHSTTSLQQLTTPLLYWDCLGEFNRIRNLLGSFGYSSLYPCYNS